MICLAVSPQDSQAKVAVAPIHAAKSVTFSGSGRGSPCNRPASPARQDLSRGNSALTSENYRITVQTYKR